jgi:hypothetical protein
LPDVHGPAATTTAPVAINFYNSFFGRWPRVPERCEAACRITTGADHARDADAVVFHIPTLGPIDGARKRDGQLWVALSMESRVMCRRLDDPGFMERFDLVMTYERSSDVWLPYFGPGTVPGLKRPVEPRTAATPVVWLQSNANDRCARRTFVGELMRSVRIDSFGAVMANRPEVIPPGHAPRMALYGRYKFTLAFENSIAPDYVTEKLYEPLTAGSVPVYRGTEDVAELAPARDCFIDARDFASAKELGAYLDHLDRCDDEYRSWHEWRSRPWSPAFHEHLERLQEPALCRLAAAVTSRLTSSADH